MLLLTSQNFLIGINLARIQVFSRGGSMKGGAPVGGSGEDTGKFLTFKSSETRFPPFWGKVSVF